MGKARVVSFLLFVLSTQLSVNCEQPVVVLPRLWPMILPLKDLSMTKEGLWKSHSSSPEPPSPRERRLCQRLCEEMNARSGLNSGQDPRHQPSPGHCLSQVGSPGTAPPFLAQPGWCLCGKDFKSNCQAPEQEKQRGLATMHSFRSLLLLILLLLVATTGPTDALRYEQKLVLVDMHNFYRSRVTPTAANMQKMYWDEDLAKFAEAYAQNCKWAPNPNRGERGESLYSLPGLEMNLPRPTWEWHHERYFYNFTTNTCKPKRTCHHYTQMVWAQSNKIGCGMHYCEKLQVKNEDKVYLLVCNYLAAGNKKGKRPYQEGPSCSLCPSIDSCESNLCEPIRGPEEVQDLPSLMNRSLKSQALI